MSTLIIPDTVDVVFVDTTSQKIIQLPLTTAKPGRTITIKDKSGLASTNPITILPNIGDGFENGAPNFTLQKNYGSITIIAKPTLWQIVSRIDVDGSDLINLPAISSLTLLSSVTGIYQAIDNVVVGAGGVTQSQWTSTFTTLGSLGYLSAPLVVMGISSAGVVASTMIASNAFFVNLGFSTAIGNTVQASSFQFLGSTGFLFTNDIQTPSLSTSIVYTGKLNASTINTFTTFASTIFASTYQFYTSSGFLLTNDIQPSSVSTLLLYTGSLFTSNIVGLSSLTTSNLIAPNILGSNLQFSTLQFTTGTGFFDIPAARMAGVFASTIVIASGTMSNVAADTFQVSTMQFSTLTSLYSTNGFLNMADMLTTNISTVSVFASSVTATAFIAPIGDIDVLYGSNIFFCTIQSYQSTGFFNLADFQTTNLSANTLAAGTIRANLLTGLDTIQVNNVSTTNVITCNVAISSLQVYTSTGFFDIQDSRFSALFASTIFIQRGNIATAAADTLLVSTITFSSLTTNYSVSSFLQASDLFSSNISTNNLYVGNVQTNQVNTSNLVAQTATFIGKLAAPGINISSLTAQYYSTSSFNLLSGDFLISSLLSTGSIQAGSLQSLSISTNSIVGSNLIFSSIQFANSAFLDFTDMRIQNLSTQRIFTSSFNTNNYVANNFLIGNTSNTGYIGFFGTSGNFNNSVLTELSTGTTTQEFLIFRGSSVADQIRLQTTGAIRFESGVPSRLYPNIPQVTPPSLLINSSSNVGILTENPQAALDVGGTIRAPFVSSQQLQISSLQIASRLFPPNYWFGSTTFVSANTVNADTFVGNNFIGGSFKGDGSLLSNINVSSGLAIAVNFGSTLTMSTGILRSGGLFLGTAIV